MWAWVMTICFTFSLCWRTMARTSSILSPGSMTMASCVVSSPMIEQLHCSGPTGRILWIIPSFSLRPRQFTTLPRVVIPNEVRDLQFAAICRSLTSFGMTIHERYVSLLRCRREVPRRLIRPEAQECRDVAGAIQSVVLLEIEQFDVAADGDGDDGVADVGEFASSASASDARSHQVGVQVAAVRALDGSGRKILAEEDGLHLPGLQCLQDSTEAGDTAPVALGELQRFADFRRGAFRDPLIQESRGVVANLFIR